MLEAVFIHVCRKTSTIYFNSLKITMNLFIIYKSGVNPISYKICVLYPESNYGSIRSEIIHVRLCALKDCHKACSLANMKILLLCNNYFQTLRSPFTRLFYHYPPPLPNGVFLFLADHCLPPHSLLNSFSICYIT